MFKVKYYFALPDDLESGVDLREKIEAISDVLFFFEMLISLSALILFWFSVCYLDAIFRVKSTVKSSSYS